MALGPVSVANDVVFAGSMDRNPRNPTMFALDANTGRILWSFGAGGAVNAAPAIVGDSVFWGSGSQESGIGTTNLFAFSIGED
jgi:polyvinyl alcohol dehydrogenase (cytochrome)